MKKALCVFLGVLMASWVQAEDVIAESGNGGINWTEGYVYAYGYGVAADDTPERKKRLLARRAAQVDAYRNLAEILQGVRVNSETTVQDMVLASDVVRTKVEGLVKGAVMTKDHYQNDIAQVTMQVPIDGGLSQATNQPKLFNSSADNALIDHARAAAQQLAQWLLPAPAYAASPLISSPADYDFAQRILQSGEGDVLKTLAAEVEAYGSTSSFSGLLVDATSVANFQLATIPRLRNEAGDIIYPTEELFDEVLSAKRPVSYDFDVGDAISNERVATNPLIVKATGVFKSRMSDLVVDQATSDALLNNARLMGIVNQAGVMIVVAP